MIQQPCRFLYLLSFLGFFTACRFSDSNEDSPVPPVTYQKAPVQVRYEVEQITFVESIDKNPKTKYLSSIAAIPMIMHNKVKMGIFADGTPEWVITHLEPSPQWRLPSAQAQIPKDESPKTVRTHIKNGKGYFFDAQDRLIRTHPLLAQGFVDLVELLKKDQIPHTQIASRIIAGTGVDVNQRIADARAKGYQVDASQGGRVTIKATIDYTVLNPFVTPDPSAEKFILIEVLATDMKVLLSSTLYTLQNQLVSQTIYDYQTGSDSQLELTHLNQKVYTKDANGTDVVSSVDTYIRDLELEYNFNN